jgi:hypothetical protein
MEGCVGACVDDSLAGCGRGGFIDVQNVDSSALLREPNGNGLTDSASAAGDDGNFAIEPESSRIRVWVGQSDTPRFQGMKSS